MTQTPATSPRIVVIGGGVGGLAVAYNAASALAPASPQITVVEAQDRFGGNADTAQFSFGEGPYFESAPFKRWADLGVNDFNTAAYTEIVKVMNAIGFVKGIDYLNLEDSTSYYSTDGKTYFTDNTITDSSTPDPWWGTAMKDRLPNGEALAKSVADFMLVAGKDAENRDYASYTVEEYIDEMSPVHGWDERLGPLVIYPRINGMYFTSQATGPRKMPFAAVMHYYKIQEGAGGQKADRNYFVGGASHWIDALTKYMAANMPSVRLETGFKALVTPNGKGGWSVKDTNSGKVLEADAVVLATHADQALRAMGDGLPPVAANLLAQITYEDGISVAHTDSRIMPVDRNCWCTYNIVIHEPGSVALKPYVINYVANRHQNDGASAEYSKFGLPEFFVSINPYLPIPEDMVLKDVNGNPAVANLRHNIYDFACMNTQAEIDNHHQGEKGIFYAGGWTRGSGLHEECWLQGQHVAELLYKYFAGAPTRPEKPVPHAELITSRLQHASATDQI